jgi:hypothetical protein
LIVNPVRKGVCELLSAASADAFESICIDGKLAERPDVAVLAVLFRYQSIYGLSLGVAQRFSNILGEHPGATVNFYDTDFRSTKLLDCAYRCFHCIL